MYKLITEDTEGQTPEVMESLDDLAREGARRMIAAALEVEVELLSSDAVRVHEGMPVRLLRWGGDEALEAVVKRVEPTGFTKISALGVEEQRVLVICAISSDYSLWSGLGDGYRVEAQFVLWEQPDTLQVPVSALFRSGDDWSVFRVENGRAVITPLTLGQNSGLAAEVLSGLESGDRVVIYPADTIGDGVSVSPR